MKNRNITIIIKAILLAPAFLAICPKMQAVVPAPDGGYPGGNTAEGQNALLSQTTGLYNTAVGIFSLLSLTGGNFCTGVGAGTLLANTADENTATGAGALLSNSAGTRNTANGAFALFNNTTGVGETAAGDRALFGNTTGDFNTAIGSAALQANTLGENNTAVGAATLILNTAGSRNTATGVQALFLNAASDNTAFGYKALDSNNTGFFNTAAGDEALQANTIGSGNTAVGYFALHNNITGGGNIAIGVGAGTNITGGDNNIYIGNVGLAGDSNTTRIGIAKTTQRTFINGIRGVTTGINDAVNVVIDSAGQFGTISSSRRFKTDIKPMDNASGSILALKPVTFHYKSQKDAKPQFGLIAEEVAEVNPDLVVRDESGQIYTVRYDAVNAMLLNEFLKEHKAFIEEQCKVEQQDRKIQEQEAIIVQLTRQIETVVARLDEHDSEIQRVSDQLKLTSPATQVVANNH
jgi:Chaperone of endosialidase